MSEKALNVKESKYLDNLQYSFTAEELAEKAQIMSEQSTLKAELEDQKKAVMSDFKAQIDKCDADLNLAAKHYRDKWMMKNVTCIKRMNYDNGMVEFIRTDTDEIYKSRKMEGDELNIPLPTDDTDVNPVQ
ncbi:hypothetical protein [Desulfovibrio gilichinskyi]|uniref:Uncharacterized protein n=1 Tax=Desulfovibrio gilichinskyi TaxID=1519643 RepID=A0A1X7C395_9BACT|nr:hypothetical protein [Desulfovibrio gilichinskyi]SME89261.1 hypothetical protein SAMN06295933_0261 [Desulfovibrio gilichinskyi]